MFKKVDVKVKYGLGWQYITTMKIPFWKNGVEEFKIRYKMTRDWINENNEIINIHEREIVITTKGYCI